MFFWQPSGRAFHRANFDFMANPDRPKPTSDLVAHGVTADHTKGQAQHDLDADAQIALDEARKLEPGPKRAEAMKLAGSLRRAADLRGIIFPQRGRPRKT